MRQEVAPKGAGKSSRSTGNKQKWGPRSYSHTEVSFANKLEEEETDSLTLILGWGDIYWTSELYDHIIKDVCCLKTITLQ